MSATSDVTNAIARLRREVCDLHAELPRNELVVWTAGNVSARVPGRELLVIKPSGVRYDELTPETMVVTDFDGVSVDGEHAPSSDTAAHAYVYRHMPEVNGQVHTHSTYATAWAARGEAIPCVLTMMGDEFGGEVPIGPVHNPMTKHEVCLTGAIGEGLLRHAVTGGLRRVWKPDGASVPRPAPSACSL